jgi:hypothetical protein
MVIFEVFSYGNAENSQALLYRQKRTTWNSAPNNSVFYECYIVNVKYTYGNNKIYLLDNYLNNEISSFENGLLLINIYTSKEIDVSNRYEIVLQENIIYKCIVLYQGSILGKASVNIFNFEPANQNIGYVSEGFSFGSFDVNDKNLLEYLSSDEYGIPMENGLVLTGGLVVEDREGNIFDNPIREYLNRNSLYVYLPQSKRNILQLNQWPNPKIVNIIDALVVLEIKYNAIVSSFKSSNSVISVRDYTTNRNININVNDIIANARNQYNNFRAELSRYNLLIYRR